jgi:hypothetical protein
MSPFGTTLAKGFTIIIPREKDLCLRELPCAALLLNCDRKTVYANLLEKKLTVRIAAV